MVSEDTKGQPICSGSCFYHSQCRQGLCYYLDLEKPRHWWKNNWILSSEVPHSCVMLVIFWEHQPCALLFPGFSPFLIIKLIEKVTFSAFISHIPLIWFLSFISINALNDLLACLLSCWYLNFFLHSKLHAGKFWVSFHHYAPTYHSVWLRVSTIYVLVGWVNEWMAQSSKPMNTEWSLILFIETSSCIHHFCPHLTLKYWHL